MKTQLFVILILFFVLNSCNQTNTEESKISEINLDYIFGGDSAWAEKEFSHDTNYKLMLISMGIPEETDYYFWTILENEYNIEKKFGVGCIVSKGISYYNDLMENEINKRYGKDFFQTVNAKVDSIYQVDKPLIKKVKQLCIVDSSYILNFEVFNTPNIDIKVVSGFGWRKIQDKIWYTNLFRIAIDRQKLKVISIDTTQIGIEPSKQN